MDRKLGGREGKGSEGGYCFSLQGPLIFSSAGICHHSWSFPEELSRQPPKRTGPHAHWAHHAAPSRTSDWKKPPVGSEETEPVKDEQDKEAEPRRTVAISSCRGRRLSRHTESVKVTGRKDDQVQLVLCQVQIQREGKYTRWFFLERYFSHRPPPGSLNPLLWMSRQISEHVILILHDYVELLSCAWRLFPDILDLGGGWISQNGNTCSSDAIWLIAL